MAEKHSKVQTKVDIIESAEDFNSSIEEPQDFKNLLEETFSCLTSQTKTGRNYRQLNSRNMTGGSF